MSKILVERPRYGATLKFRARRHAFDRKSRSRDDEQVLPKQMGMGFGRGKSLNENLQPLRAFLLSQRGRNWDQVYGEIRSRLAPRSAVDMHVMQHLRHYVLFARRERDGTLVLTDDYGRIQCELRATGEVHGRWGCDDVFFVCAETRRLLYIPRKAKLKRAAQFPRHTREC
ncbi:MAG: hypothetical protein QM778_33340 [Myxococcales bacterium]